MEFFDKALGELLDLEGGYSDHVADRGGKTNWGITVAAARRNGYMGDMKDYPLEHARQVYLKDYWAVDRLRLGAISLITGAAVASEIFEQGVNTGVLRTAKRVQRVLNVLNRCERLYPDLKVDGWLGGTTRESLTILISLKGDDDLYRWLNIAQGAYYLALLEGDADQDQEAFARGWAKRVRVNKEG